MKRGTPDHPKLKQLAETLKINEAWAVGLVELLFHSTSRYAPQGNIGKWSDEAIAAHLRWPRTKASALISALITSGWLDRDPDHRLLVHGWEDHADQSVRKTLKNIGQDFMRPSRTSCVYFIRATVTNQIKIGVTSQPAQRFADLQRNTTEKLEYLGYIEGGYELENEMHNRFKSQRVRGEWFKSSDELLLIIKERASKFTGSIPASVPTQDGIAKPFLALPEPEPEARAQVPTPIPFPSIAPSWQADETYLPFVEAWREVASVTGKPLIEEDFTDAHFRWGRLDFTQKLQATQGVKERLRLRVWTESTDPQYIPLPGKYLEKEYKRPVVAPKARDPATQPYKYERHPDTLDWEKVQAARKLKLEEIERERQSEAR